MPEKLPVIAIVGRPNVGKSALFNAILRQRISIVHEQSGVTRDHLAAPGDHGGMRFLLVDTGGLAALNRERNVELFDGLIREQVTQVVQDAAVLIWVVNAQDGITPQDEEVAAFLRKTGKPVVLCANKCDNGDLAQAAPVLFAKFGIREIKTTSCAHNLGIDRLMDAVLAHVDKALFPNDGDAEKRLRIAVVGRPNVGKSSFVNRIFGEQRVMVSDIPGTTRDAIDVPVTLQLDGEELPVTLVDTAGMRRKKQVDTVVEFFSVNRTEMAIRRSDIVLFVIDSLEPCTAQERRIGRLIVDARKPCIMLANKWDLIQNTVKPKDLIDKIRAGMPFLDHAPIQIISALNGYNFRGLFAHLQHVRNQMNVTIPTSVFNQFLQDALLRNPPISVGQKRFKIFYGTMVFTPPPKFVLFVNDSKLCPANYKQFLENQIRDAFFAESGMQVTVDFRARQRLEDAAPERQAAAGAKRKREAEYQAVHRRAQRSRGK